MGGNIKQAQFANANRDVQSMGGLIWLYIFGNEGNEATNIRANVVKLKILALSMMNIFNNHAKRVRVSCYPLNLYKHLPIL